MFKWKRRQSEVAKKQPVPQLSVAEKDEPVPYDLFGAQIRILGDNALTIVDAGRHRGRTTEQYLKNFPRARVLAIEAMKESFAGAKNGELAADGRVELINAILSDTAGFTEVRGSGNDGSPMAPEKVDTVTVTDICTARNIEYIDILKLNNRGSELQALKGAETMLSRGAIRLVVLSARFSPRHDMLPTFWYTAEYLRKHGYALQGLYEWHHDRQMPAILQEAEAIFVAPQMQVAPETTLAPPLLDAVAETVTGLRLPDRFLGNVRLQEGAAIRSQAGPTADARVSDQQVGGSPGLASITNVIIDTSPEPYRYSVVLDADREIMRHVGEAGIITLEVSIKVIAGKIGVVWADENYQPLASSERYISGAPGIQRALLAAPSKKAHHLVFRNVADDSTRATFKLSGIKARVIGDSIHPRAVDGSDPEALYLRAHALARAGDLNMAARLFGDAATLVPNYAAAVESQGEMLDMLGQSDTAMAKYDTVRSLRAETREGSPDRTFALRRRGRSTAEIAAYTSMAQSAKHRPLPHIARGNAFLAEGRANEALADYEAALRLKPTSHEITALKGEALAMLGCYLEALEAFDLAIAARPLDVEALSGRAIVHLALGRLQAADADWRRQFELLPAARASARACVALRLADYETALPELERALEKEKTDPYWRLYRLTALRRLGRQVVPNDTAEVTGGTPKGWPGPLLALHTGKLAGEQVLAQADNDGRRAEALFQLGVLALPRDRDEARRHWMEIVTQLKPELIEHAAARHELDRLGS